MCFGAFILPCSLQHCADLSLFISREVRLLSNELRVASPSPARPGTALAPPPPQPAFDSPLSQSSRVKETSELRDQITELQNQVASERRRADMFAAREKALQTALKKKDDELAAMAQGREAPRLDEPVDTRSAIARDKAVHKLGLRRLSALPHDTVVKLLQDACVEIQLSDPWQLASALHRMTAVVTSVPRLEKVSFV